MNTLKKIALDLYDRIVNQKITTAVGVVLIGVGLIDPEPYTKITLITIGVGLLTGKDSYFRARK